MREIMFECGATIDECVDKISKYKNGDVYGNFNGKKFYPDTTIDEAYLLVTGLTKKDKEARDIKDKEEYEKKQKEFKNSIPELTKDYINKAKGLIKEDTADYWAKIVPIRLSDLYNGMELGNMLEIAEPLKKGDLITAKEILIGQCHSGMSHGLICSMIREFCFNGDKFVDLIKDNKDV